MVSSPAYGQPRLGSSFRHFGGFSQLTELEIIDDQVDFDLDFEVLGPRF